jgi:UDP-N-acetylglucosamine 2-epimerase (non-hydrolysing)
MIKLNFVTGTAAELIKIYPIVLLALQRGHQVRIISTGQSRENFLMQYRDLNLPENILTSLLPSSGDLRKASSALAWFVRAILTSKKTFRAKILQDGLVVVHGDTLSTLVGSWLAWRCGNTIAHIEAGLRSANLLNPFPEEITRRLVSRFAHFHMAPDATAAQNLRLGGRLGTIVDTKGNTLLDAVLLSAHLTHAKTPERPFALVNIHRFENLHSATRWQAVVDTVVEASKGTHLIFVTHPQTRHKLVTDPQSLRALTRPEIEIRERMPFSEFIALLKASRYLISDGGSNQEECFYLGKPCLLLRETTERREGLDASCVLSRFDTNVIMAFLQNPEGRTAPAVAIKQSPSAIILETLEKN